MDEEQSRVIVETITAHLRGLAGPLLYEYVRQVYRVGAGDLSTEVIYVCEANSGNIERRELSSIPVRVWEVRGDVYQIIPFVDMRPYNAASGQGKIWPHPHLKFFANLPYILVSECIGVAPDHKWGERRLVSYRKLTIHSED